MENDILNNIWPEWRVVKRIGRGSFGEVYEAVRTDSLLESRAAVKVISIPQNESEIDTLRSEGLSKDATRVYLQGIVKDFVTEIQLMDSLKGVQNIVSVEDYKVIEKPNGIGWDICIRMELLTPLNSYISNKTLSEKRVIKLGVDICTALELCAKRHIIHRDVKPENIFINQFGDFKLGDFGIARKLGNVTGGLSKKGTYSYMAPEVERSNRYDSTVDLYSLGLVLYRFMNRNRLPFLDTERQLLNPNERMAAVRRRMNGEPLPAPCDASPAMAQAILCACAYDPGRRFSSATAMKNALLGVENSPYKKTMPVPHAPQMQDLNRTVLAQPTPSAPKPIHTFGKKKKSRVPYMIGTVLAAFLVVAGGAFLALGFNHSAETDVVEETEETKEIKETKSSISAENDERQILDSIEKAEEFAASEDYESALEKIRTALYAYPESKELQEKETEYMDAFADQVKTAAFEDASKAAESGDYTSAILELNKATAVLGDDEEITEKMQEYTSRQQDATATSPPAEESPADTPALYSPNPFYGVWCFASKSYDEAQSNADAIQQKGFPAQVFVTTDWSNLNSEEWYVVTAGVYTTEEEAKAALSGVQSICPGAYVKYSGGWQGV